MDLAERLKLTISTLPEQPGVYRYFDETDTIIYVGKAKNLKKRVSSYFTKQHYENRKTQVMVSKIRRIEFTIVDTQYDALLLENNLIKELQPRYNVSMRDDKSYPLIKITRERFPKIFPMRNPVDDGSEYFGPYASVRMMNAVYETVRNLYPTRNCNLNLSEENIRAGKYKVCLEYHIGNCKGPCTGLQSEADYMQTIDHIRKILKGKIGEVKRYLQQQMDDAASQFRFEDAAWYKKRLDLLDTYQSKSTIVSNTLDEVDVFGIVDDDRSVFVNYMKVTDGIVVQTQTIELKRRIDEPQFELLEIAIAEMRSRYDSTSNEVIVPYEIELEDQDVKFTVPKGGDKKKLLDLAKLNAQIYQKNKLTQREKLDPELRVERLMEQMQKDLNLKSKPYHIECFDNSNFHGAYPVSACVVFKNGRPSKKDYRHFNVRTVEGPNDFATMKEVITRRYTRLVEEEQSLPQLVIIDGGKGQLSAAVEALQEVGVYGQLAVVGIAKRLEEIYYPEDPVPLHIDKKSETLKVIQQMRDEAHRFGITHHRNRRDKGTLVTELTSIKGIGEETSKILLQHFKSVKKIKEAPEKELEEVVGLSKAKLVYQYFHAEEG